MVTSTLNGNLALAANVTINTADDGTTPGLTISAPISGAFTLTKGGAGTLTFNSTTAANSYTGTTTVNSGTLLLGDTGGVAVPGNLVVGDSLGGQGSNKADVVRLLVSNQIQPTAAVSITDSGLLDLNGFNNTIGTGQTNALTITGGSVTTGTGTLTLGGNVSDLASGPDITPATISGNLNLGGATRIFDVQGGALVGENPNGTVQNPGVALPNLNDLTISAVISNGSLTKTDTGKLQLSGNNSYAGATTINGGTLLVDGSQPASAVTVNPTATVNTGGELAPWVPFTDRGRYREPGRFLIAVASHQAHRDVYRQHHSWAAAATRLAGNSHLQPTRVPPWVMTRST